MPLLAQLENVEVVFPGSARPALQSLSWTIMEGAHCSLLGANGSGKSTLLRVLAGQQWVTRGRIAWHGPAGPEESPIYGRSISALVSPAMQENCQRAGFSATFKDALLGAFDESPLSFAAREIGSENLQAVQEVARSLRCADFLEMPLYALSQGQLRILLCARAILRRPRLCLLDEALDGLDASRKNAFFGLLAELAPKTTVIAATHRADGIPAFCRESRHLSQGRFARESCSRRVATAHSGIRGEGAEHPLLTLNNIDVFIDGAPVLRKITWTTRQGEHWRISGENGSGKSTLLRLLAGEENAASNGTLIRWLPAIGRPAETLDELRQGIRLVSDLSQALYGYDVSGLDLVCSGFEQSVGLYREYSDSERQMARALLERFFSAEEARTLAGTSIRRLSTGQLRRLFLARALVGDPAILLLDEPATGLDAQSRAKWFGILARLAQSMQIILVSHYDEDVPPFVNREARMREGRLEVVR